MDTSNRSANPSSAFLDGSISPRSSLPIAFLSNLQHSASAHRFNLFLSLSLFSLSGNSFKGYPSFGWSGSGIQWVILPALGPISVIHSPHKIQPTDVPIRSQRTITLCFSSGNLSLTLIHSLILSALLRLEADHPHHIIDLYLFALEWELFAVRAGYRFEHFFF